MNYENSGRFVSIKTDSNADVENTAPPTPGKYESSLKIGNLNEEVKKYLICSTEKEKLLLLRKFKIELFPSDRFKKIAHAGSGAFGKVYFIWDQSIKLEIALKTFDLEGEERAKQKISDGDITASFFKEIFIWRLINEKKLDQAIQAEGYYEIEEKDGSIKAFYIKMEKGTCSLQDLLNQAKSLKKAIFNKDTIMHILFCVVRTLLALKEVNIYYSDIKLGNIIYIPRPPWFALIDFGSCKLLLDDWEKKPELALPEVYTPGYASPELQLYLKKRRKLSQFNPFKSDVYSLGKVVEKILDSSVENSEISEILTYTLKDSIQNRWDLEQLRDFLFKNLKFDYIKTGIGLFRETLLFIEAKTWEKEGWKKIFFEFIKQSSFKRAIQIAKIEIDWRKSCGDDKYNSSGWMNSLFRLGVAYLWCEKLDKALKEFEKIVEINYRMGGQDKRLEREAFIACELLKSYKDNPEKAYSSIYSRVADKDPNIYFFDMKMLYHIADVHNSSEKKGSSEETLTTLQFLKENFQEIPELFLISIFTLNTKILMRENKYEEAERVLSRAIDIAEIYENVNHFELYFTFSKLKLLENSQDSLKIATINLKNILKLRKPAKMIKVDENSVEALCLLISCLYKRNKIQEALTFSELISKTPYYQETFKFRICLAKINYYRAVIENRLDKIDEALNFCIKSINIMLDTDDDNILLEKNAKLLRHLLKRAETTKPGAGITEIYLKDSELKYFVDKYQNYLNAPPDENDEFDNELEDIDATKKETIRFSS